MLNELASTYGDCDQKLASYFFQALYFKATDSSKQCYKTLVSVWEKSHRFDAARKLILKFQEVSPWTTFGHVAANSAVLEALNGEIKIHIIDINNTLCTQWPMLLEAMATRNDKTPQEKLTVVTTASMVQSVMKEVGQRMEKFARLTKDGSGIQDDEAVAINCMGTLRRVDVEQRESILRTFKLFEPHVVTVVEEEADFSSTREDFVRRFEECLWFYSLYFNTLEKSFPTTSNERLMIERECSRSIVMVLTCENSGGRGERCVRWERGVQWSDRLDKGLSPVRFSDDEVDDMKALLKRYRTVWSLVVPHGGEDQSESGLYLAWKDEPLLLTSAWKP